MNDQECIYWMALMHDLPMWSFSNKSGWTNEEKMDIIIRMYNNKLNIVDLFNLSHEELVHGYGIHETKILDFMKLKDNLTSYAFLTETLQNNGIEIIPIISQEYSGTLKKQMGKKAPLILYTKGNEKLLQDESIAVVGSRNASDISLIFTENVVKNNITNVIVSGGAKGVDQKAVDSAFTYGGKGIIVLPQGINTIESEIKKYYKELVGGNLLFISTFHPNAPRQKELAMARNSTIYALAQKIYVAESKSSMNKLGKMTKGGTYSGVKEGLKKIKNGSLNTNAILIRKPEKEEINDNNELISLGGTPVDIQGNMIHSLKQESLF